MQDTSTELTTSTFDAANRLLTAEDNSGVTTYAYDADGNQQTTEVPNGDVTTNTWSYENKLTQIEEPTGDTTDYAFALVQRIGTEQRVSKDDGVDVTRFVWDGKQMLLEVTDAGVIEARYDYTPDSFGDLISQHQNLETNYHHFDGLGSTSDLTDSAEVVTDDYAYEAFGKEVTATGTTPNPHRWVGELGYYKDEESSLYSVQQRMYDTGIGRFQSEDPIAKDENNLYRYVGNNSLNNVDPSGLVFFGDWWNAITHPSQMLEEMRQAAGPVAAKPALLTRPLGAYVHGVAADIHNRQLPAQWDDINNAVDNAVDSVADNPVVGVLEAIISNDRFMRLLPPDLRQFITDADDTIRKTWELRRLAPSPLIDFIRPLHEGIVGIASFSLHTIGTLLIGDVDEYFDEQWAFTASAVANFPLLNLVAEFQLWVDSGAGGALPPGGDFFQTGKPLHDLLQEIEEAAQELSPQAAAYGASAGPLLEMILIELITWGIGHLVSLGTRPAAQLTDDVVELAVPRSASFFDDLASQATKNANSNKLVLGKFIQEGSTQKYTKVAAHYRATYFKLENWRKLSKTLSDAELWKINQAFLRQQIKRGKQIILSHDPWKATGFFKQEVEFLRGLGYRFEKCGWVWKAVLK